MCHVRRGEAGAAFSPEPHDERHKFLSIGDLPQPILQNFVGQNLRAECGEVALTHDVSRLRPPFRKADCRFAEIVVIDSRAVQDAAGKEMRMDGPVDLGLFTAADFEARLNDPFRLHHPGGELPLKLHQVRHLAHRRGDGPAFALIFVGAPGAFLPQATYPLAHAEMGTMHVFMVPIGPIEAGNGYEAIFG